MSTLTTKVTLVTTIYDLPDELLSIISISGGPTEYCNFRRAMKRIWEYTTGREDHCIKHFLATNVNKHGTVNTTICGKFHSIFDKPAVVGRSGLQIWYQYGKKHRDNDLPAVMYSTGRKFWYQRGKLHRDNDQPAIIWRSGAKFWYKHGNCQRDNDQPAIIYPDGRKRWYKCNVEYFP